MSASHTPHPLLLCAAPASARCPRGRRPQCPHGRHPRCPHGRHPRCVLCVIFPFLVPWRRAGRHRLRWTTVPFPSGARRRAKQLPMTHGRCPSLAPSRCRRSSSLPPCRTTFSPRHGWWRAALCHPCHGPLTMPRQVVNVDVWRLVRHQSSANAKQSTAAASRCRLRPRRSALLDGGWLARPWTLATLSGLDEPPQTAL